MWSVSTAGVERETHPPFPTAGLTQAPSDSFRPSVSAHATDPDVALLARLREGDEQAFRKLVQRYHAPMLGVARLHVRDLQAAEDVVQETWMAVVKGLERFEER